MAVTVFACQRVKLNSLPTFPSKTCTHTHTHPVPNTSTENTDTPWFFTRTKSRVLCIFRVLFKSTGIPGVSSCSNSYPGEEIMEGKIITTLNIHTFPKTPRDFHDTWDYTRIPIEAHRSWNQCVYRARAMHILWLGVFWDQD